MKQTDNCPDMKFTWKNCLIWSPILLLIAAALRVLAWYLAIYKGSVDIFSDYFCWTSLGTFLFSALLPTACYIWCYASYMHKARRGPHQLQELVNGTLGKPWLPAFLGLLVMEVLYIGVCTLLIKIGCELSLSMPDDAIVFRTYLLLSMAVCLPTDLILFFIGKRLFLPDAIQRH